MGARVQPDLERGRRPASGELQLLMADHAALASEAGQRRIIQLRAAAAHDDGERPKVDVAAPSLALFAIDEKSTTAKLTSVPDWIELIPAPREGADEGHVETRDWRPGFIVPDMQALADRFNAKPEKHRAAVVDWEHKTHRNWGGGRNPAAGWIEEVEVREGALWGRIRWTEDGYSNVAKLVYRYVSPVVAIMWPADSEGRVDWDATPEATELIDAALTNCPATYIRDLAMTTVDESSDASADSHQSQLAASIAPAPAAARAPDKDRNSETTAMSQISTTTLQLLGLAADATTEQVDAAIARLAASHAPQAAIDETKLVETITASVSAQFKRELDAAKQKIEALEASSQADQSKIIDTQIESVLTAASAEQRFTPAERDDLVELGRKLGPDKLREMLSKRPSLSHLHASVGRGEGGKERDVQLTDADLHVASRLGVSPDDMRKFKEVNVRDKGRFSAQFVAHGRPQADDDDEAAA